ncbi:MAG: TIGR04076 family protein [Candidatus Bipolaricaulis sp.]|nr:TIGR04076 family protein [Candidatus Bipolaricaulis sp.]
MNARITVIKRALNIDLVETHLADCLSVARPCSVFREGMTFDVKGPFPEKPQGFCDWAWVAIYPNLALACAGAELSAGVAFPCCTDGLRPVTFQIEKIAGE